MQTNDLKKKKHIGVSFPLHANFTCATCVWNTDNIHIPNNWVMPCKSQPGNKVVLKPSE